VVAFVGGMSEAGNGSVPESGLSGYRSLTCGASLEVDSFGNGMSGAAGRCHA